MQKAKAFFYVCAGMFLFALGCHFGASAAQAQAPGNPVLAGANGVVYSSNGDAYFLPGLVGLNPSFDGWRLAGNVFTGTPPTPATKESWGTVKQRYR